MYSHALASLLGLVAVGMMIAGSLHQALCLWLAAIGVGSITTEARSALESESQHNGNEAEDEQADVDDTNGLPAAEPGLAVPAQSLQSRPEAVGEMEPESSQPYEVEHHEDGA